MWSYLEIKAERTDLGNFREIYAFISLNRKCFIVTYNVMISYILSRASKVGSPTNHPGFEQRQDTGPGILWSVFQTRENCNPPAGRATFSESCPPA